MKPAEEVLMVGMLLLDVGGGTPGQAYKAVESAYGIISDRTHMAEDVANLVRKGYLESLGSRRYALTDKGVVRSQQIHEAAFDLRPGSDPGPFALPSLKYLEK